MRRSEKRAFSEASLVFCNQLIHIPMTSLTSITFPSGRRLEKISFIKESSNLSFYSAEEHITDTIDEFGSSNEIVHSVWLAVSTHADEKTLQLWKDWSRNVKDYFGVECKEAAIIDHCLAAVLSLDNALFMDSFPESKGESFVSALCDMALRLDSLGFAYKYWNWSNIVRVGACWKLLPSSSMERTSEPNPKQALTRLGKWLLNVNCPFLQTQPARSIVELIANGQIPDEFSEEIIYEEFWRPQEQGGSPLQLKLTQTHDAILLEWEPTNEEILLLHSDGKKKAYPGQFIWRDDLDHYGKPLSNVSGINPVIDVCSGTAHWNRQLDNSRYQTLTVTPVVRRENWYELGVPCAIGGPEEAVLFEAYFDKDSKEIVLTPSWSDDRNISIMYIVIRNDRFASSVRDVQTGFPAVIAERRRINHPIRRRIRFSSKLFIVVFNAVTIDNKMYFSRGTAESCRKTITGSRLCES